MKNRLLKKLHKRFWGLIGKNNQNSRVPEKVDSYEVEVTAKTKAINARHNLDSDYAYYCDESRNLISVKKNGCFGLFSVLANRLLLEVKYDMGFRPEPNVDLYFARVKGGLAGVYSVSADKFVIPLEFDGLGHLTNDLYSVSKDCFIGVYSIKAGRLVVPLKYTSVSLNHNGSCVKLEIPILNLT
ncbi:MAG: WG repeat-containing protein [bacterium]